MAERSLTERERAADEKKDTEAPAQQEQEQEPEPPAEQVPPPAVVTKVEAKSELIIDSDTCLKLVSHALDLSTWYAKGVIRRQGGADIPLKSMRHAVTTSRGEDSLIWKVIPPSR